jgi:hypothetical protein
MYSVPGILSVQLMSMAQKTSLERINSTLSTELLQRWMVRAGFGLLAFRLIGWFVNAEKTEAIVGTIFTFVLLPIVILWCAKSLNESKQSGKVTLNVGYIKAQTDRTTDPMLYGLYRGSYWITLVGSVAFIFLETLRMLQ